MLPELLEPALVDELGSGIASTLEMYPAHNSNETFTEDPVPRCGAATVTATGPFADRKFDQRYQNYGIVQLRYNNALGVDLRVATSASVNATQQRQLGHATSQVER